MKLWLQMIGSALLLIMAVQTVLIVFVARGWDFWLVMAMTWSACVWASVISARALP